MEEREGSIQALHKDIDEYVYQVSFSLIYRRQTFSLTSIKIRYKTGNLDLLTYVS